MRERHPDLDEVVENGLVMCIEEGEIVYEPEKDIFRFSPVLEMEKRIDKVSEMLKEKIVSVSELKERINKMSKILRGWMQTFLSEDSVCLSAKS